MDYRLGLDMGATSIGWAIYDLKYNFLIDCGVRIFDDGREDKSKASLCVKRRQARSARRLNDRRHIKTKELLKILTEMGLFPTKETKNLNPYALRKEALDKKLEPHELGRAFLQLAKRKGFLSNRKDNKAEGGKLKSGYEELKTAMESEKVRSYGEFLYHRLQNNEKIRLKDTFNDAGQYVGGLFPFREVYINEFDLIWEKQKVYYPKILTDENKNKIKSVMFFQRPLKEAEEGECIFEKGEKRIPKAHPLFQEFRIWQNVLNLKFAQDCSPDYETLSKDKLDYLIRILQNPVAVKANASGIIVYGNIKKVLGLDKNGVFNFERSSRQDKDLEKGLLVNTTQNAINKSQHFYAFWDKFTDQQKGEIINVIARPHRYIDCSKKKCSIEEENQEIIQYLCDHFALSQQAAEELLFEIDLEDDFGSLSEKAISKILPFMKQGFEYSEACQEAGYHHSDKKYDSLDFLPYYGKLLSQSCIGQKTDPKNDEERYGKIGNATVHVALNQVRHLINEIISHYGKPSDISVEYARDLPASADDRKKIRNAQDANEAENQKILKELNEKLGQGSYNKRDIEKYKIWQKLSWYDKNPLIRECPFCGKPISIEDLLNGQKVQIEHLIPFSRSFDDSLDNKVLAYVEANRYKGNRTPYEAFGENKDGYDWQEIQHRAKKLSMEQQWRFSKDAIKKFEEKEGPIARSLNDTRYMTRLLQDYLQPIVKEDGKKRVQAVVGALTAMIRKAWGLDVYKDKENQEDYRAFHNHHALDAIIVAVISRHAISQTAHELKFIRQNVKEQFKDELYKLYDENVSKEDKKDLKKRIKDFISQRKEAIINQHFRFPENLKREDLLQKVAQINISHKPSLKNIKDTRSTIGKLHEDTAYGLQKFVDDKSLTAVFKCCDTIIEKSITEYIPMFYDKADKKAYYDAYKSWFIISKKASTMIAKTKEEKAIKKQIAENEQNTIYQLRNAARKAFKWFIGGNNYCAEIYEINPKNKIGGMPTNDQGEWKVEVVSNYNATVRYSRSEEIYYWRYKYPNAKRIMTLRRNDMVLATFTREQAFDEKFIKGLKGYLREKFEQKPDLQQIDVLFRVKKMGANGICFTPHDIAKEKDDTKSWIASASSLQTYKARKVHVNFMGRIQNG